jgi:hypothetical protein
MGSQPISNPAREEVSMYAFTPKVVVITGSHHGTRGVRLGQNGPTEKRT